MMLNPSTAGLLSRLGSSLMSPGAFVDQSEFVHFSTNTLLDAFEAGPRFGSALVPVLAESSDRPYGGPLRMAALQKDSTPGVRRALDGILADAEKIVKSQRRFGIDETYPLTMTEGRWIIKHFDKGDSEAEMELKSSSHKLRRIRRADNGLYELTVGWEGEQATALQRLSFGFDGEVRTDGYDFEFFDGGMASLTAYFGLEGEPGPRAVLELAERIYHSTLYATLYARGQIQGEPPSLPQGDPKEMKSISIALRDAKDPSHALSHISWQDDDNGGHLEISLSRAIDAPLSALMPLLEPLHELLWEGALHLIY